MKLMCKFLNICMISLLTCGTSFASGITLGGTRLIYDATKKEANIELSNSDDNNYYLIQAWISDFKTNKKQTPFIITPPLFKLFPNNSSMIRVVYVANEANQLPDDRESVYLLNARAIPAIEKDTIENKLIIATQNIIKLIYRPKGLTSKGASDAYKQIKISRKNNDRIVINNPTPYAITLRNLKINFQIIERPGVLMPFSELEFDVKDKNASFVELASIDDFGSTLPHIKVNIR